MPCCRRRQSTLFKGLIQKSRPARHKSLIDGFTVNTVRIARPVQLDKFARNERLVDTGTQCACTFTDWWSLTQRTRPPLHVGAARCSCVLVQKRRHITSLFISLSLNHLVSPILHTSTLFTCAQRVDCQILSLGMVERLV
jgi:hypothetical protein